MFRKKKHHFIQKRPHCIDYLLALLTLLTQLTLLHNFTGGTWSPSECAQ